MFQFILIYIFDKCIYLRLKYTKYNLKNFESSIISVKILQEKSPLDTINFLKCYTFDAK